jgi:transcriptional regulator GlxA family with amidase domain
MLFWDEQSMGADSRRRVVVVAYPQVDVLDVAGPCEVFASVQDALYRAGVRHQAGYTVEVFSTSRALTIDSDSAVRLQAHRSILDYRGTIDTLLVAGGLGSADAAKDPALLRWLRRMAGRVRRFGSVCTGAFVLAAAGLLNGRRVTTHWRYCAQLARAYPQIEVDPDCIFIRDGPIFTSAGVTAGMDLALALVEEDYGRAIALAIARHLVLFIRRPGGQCQFSAQLQIQAADREPLRELQGWVAEHLDEDLSVERLAARVHMSVRNFARVFRQQVGWTPARFVEQLRVEAARRRLEESDKGLVQVACECGFGSADSMCRSFLRHLQVTPRDYRSRFQASPRTLSCYPNSNFS